MKTYIIAFRRVCESTIEYEAIIAKTPTLAIITFKKTGQNALEIIGVYEEVQEKLWGVEK